MSSNDIIKSVSKKLKYYFEVKRLEDGFDLSAPDCPKLDHPPMKARPTLMYDGLHDRPLKHYFSPHEVRAVLTQFKPPEGTEGRETDVRTKVKRYMRRQTFITPVLDDSFYVQGRKGRRLRNDMQGGFGVPLRRNKPAHRGGYPVLRTVPNRYLSHAEANRLVNIASRLLVATESADVKLDGSMRSGDDVDQEEAGQLGEKRSSTVQHKSKENSPSGKTKKNQRSKSTKGQRKVKGKKNEGHSIYTYDISGKRVLLKRGQGDTGEDSAYSTRPGSAIPPTGADVADKEEEEEEEVPVKPWLRREIRKAGASRYDDDYGRPKSAASKQPRPPSTERPLVLRPGSARLSGRHSPDNHHSRAWHSQSSSSTESSNSSYSSRSSSPAEERAIQTGPELLDNYDPSSRVVDDGEMFPYQVRVYTGKGIGASTHAEIHMVLIGEHGRTPDISLTRSLTHKVKFQTGQEDVFDILCGDIGAVKKIGIGHDSRETRDGWYLERVSVLSRGHGQAYYIPCDCWLSPIHGDGITFRDFDVQTTSSYKLDSVSDERGAKRADVTVVPATGPHLSEDQDDANINHQSTTSEAQKDDQQNRVTSPSKVQRRDDFFDQRVHDKDYSSVIESLSTATDQDNRDDFPTDRPDTGEDSARYLQDRRDLTKYGLPDDKDTARLSLTETETAQDSVPQTSVKDKEFLDGFQAGLEAAKQAQREEVEATVEVSQETSKVDGQNDSVSGGQSVHAAAKTGNLDRLKKLSSQYPEFKIKADERGRQPLHIAAAHGQLETVKWLSFNVVDLDVLTPTGYTPIHLAAGGGHTNCMMVLADMGARVDNKSVDGRTALHQAALNGHLESCKWLVANRADLSSEDVRGQTPLDLSQASQHTDVFNFLLACERDKSRPDSSLAQIRSRSPSLTQGEVGSAGKNAAGGMELYGVAEEDEKIWHDDRPSTARLTVSRSDEVTSSDSNDSDDDDSSHTDYKAELTTAQREKHDQQLMEKRAEYERQMADRRQSSFLDSIRQEYD